MGTCGGLDGVPDQEGREGGAAKHHQAHRYGVGDCSRGDGCCLRYGEGGNPMSMTLETLAATKADFRLAAFIQENFLRKQVADIKMIGDFLTKMKRVGTGLGVHMVDKDLTAFINTRKAHTEVR